MERRRLMRLHAARRGVTVCFAALLLSLIAACGSDQVAGIEGSGAPVASAATTTGRISGFGSIFVDGVEFDTATAQIRIDDQPATEADLRVGHVVTIAGTINPDGKTGTASQVTMTSDVRGGVGAVDATASTFLVLGQTVKVTSETLFDTSTQTQDLAGLQPGTQVRVSGFTGSTGEVVASRVDGLATTLALDVQVTGKVRNLDVVAKSFQMNDLTVDYRSANVSGALDENSNATVRGTPSTDGATLTATEVTVAPPPSGNTGDKGQIEGLITTFDSSTSFVVDGQRVTTDASTRLNLHGLTLGPDVFVKVHGTFDASHVLVADQVDAKPSAASLTRGLVDAVSVANGTLTLMGVTVQTAATTTFDDQGNDRKRQFGLADVRVGDYLEVRGTAVPGEPVLASIVQRSKGEARSYLQGVATDLASPAFKVLGVSVTIDSQTSFPGLGDGTKGADAFFAQAANQLVRVRGTMNGNTLIADQVRIVSQ
jgi:hypothetical protein